jgi:hypothetical protein
MKKVATDLGAGKQERDKRPLELRLLLSDGICAVNQARFLPARRPC